MDTLKAIEKRKSTRSYQQKTVEPDKIEQIVAAAKNAPKAGEFHISVIENKEILKELNDVTLAAMKNSGVEFLMGRAALEGYQPLYGAPVLFLLSAPDGNPYGTATTSCAAANITIAATAIELASCYVVTPALGLAGKTELEAKIGIPEGFTALCGVLTGYSGADAFTVPKAALNNVNYCK